MDIEAVFSKCSDDPRKLSRSTSGSYSVWLRNVYGGLSSMSPVIICDMPEGTHFNKNYYNYVEIGDFKYWVIDATYTPQEHWIFSLKKDLIGSYLEQLLNCDAIATRTNTGEYSFITDSQVPIQNSTSIRYISSNIDIGTGNACYVLTVAGSGIMALDDAATQVAKEKQAAQQLLDKESEFYDTLIAHFAPQP